MAKYRLINQVVHLYGGGIYGAKSHESAWFLLECGHVVGIDHVKWDAKKRQCSACAGGDVHVLPSFLLRQLREYVESPRTATTWDDIAEEYRPKS